VLDDDKRMLFDLTSIPHKRIDFQNVDEAILALRAGLEDRIRESNALNDARIQIAVKTLSQDEFRLLKFSANLPPNHSVDFSDPSLKMPTFSDQRGIDGLLQKGCFEAVAIAEDRGSVLYQITPFGQSLAEAITKSLATLPPLEPPGRHKVSGAG